MRRLAGAKAGMSLLSAVTGLLCVAMSLRAQVPASSPTSTNPTPTPQVAPSPQIPAAVLTLDEAERLAMIQASTFTEAKLNERIAAEDVKQAQAAFLPKVSAPLSYIYTSPALGLQPG